MFDGHVMIGKLTCPGIFLHRDAGEKAAEAPCCLFTLVPEEGEGGAAEGAVAGDTSTTARGCTAARHVSSPMQSLTRNIKYSTTSPL